MSEEPPRRTVLFLCSPGLGILDTWLPVLAEIRSRASDVQIVAFLPRRERIWDIVPDDTLVRLADELVDWVVVPRPRGGFYRAAGFASASAAVVLTGAVHRLDDRLQKAATRAAGSHRRGWRLRLAGGLHRVLRGGWIRRLVDTVDGVRRRRDTIDVDGLFAATGALCYDVYVEDKPENARVLEGLPATPRYSLLHGVSIVTPTGPAAAPRSDGSVVAYLFSERERRGYRHNYGLADEALRIVGVPRHAEAWRQRLVEASGTVHETPSGPFVLVISRPSSGADVKRGYLPLARKRAALEDLRDVVVDELGLPVVVKLHPKERERDLYEAVFGVRRYGTSWCFSRAHPVALAQHSLFAVCFYSGVAVDLVSCGVPVVERLDLRGLESWDVPEARRDDRGRPVLAYRDHGLVFGADDREQLQGHARSIVADRQGKAERLRAAYRALFPAPDRSAGAVADDVLAALGGSRPGS